MIKIRVVVVVAEQQKIKTKTLNDCVMVGVSRNTGQTNTINKSSFVQLIKCRSNISNICLFASTKQSSIINYRFFHRECCGRVWQ